MTQNFTVVEAQTEKKGVHVPVKQTVVDVRAILDGKVDRLKPEDLSYIGALKDLDEKLKSLPPEKTTESAQINSQISQPPSPVATQPAEQSKN